MQPPPSPQPLVSSSSSAAAAKSSPRPPQPPILLLFAPFLLLLVLVLFFISSPSPHAPSLHSSPPSLLPASLPSPPSFAYLLSAPSVDGESPRRLLRLLLSVYHPRNLYLLHLHLPSSRRDRLDLALPIRSHPLLSSATNIHILGAADFAYPRGSSALSAVLHGAAVLLRVSQRWDWFVNLDVGDYPLVTQDDLLHVFSFLPKDLNFVQHSGHIGWRESRRLKPIIVDPGLYLSSKAQMFYATQKRDLPTSFKIFTGYPSVILSRKFIEHAILGTDNLPRVLLMYYANTPSSHTAYFQTLLCNSPEFNETIVNNHLHYIRLDSALKREPRMLNVSDWNNMTQSGAVFGAGFSKDNSDVLDLIDQEILNRSSGKIVPGGWCLGEDSGDRCTTWGASDVLRPGPGAKRLAETMVQMLSDESYRSNRCTWDESSM